MSQLGKCNWKKLSQVWISAVILLAAVLASAQNASSPPSPPTPAAPPSPTIQVPGQQQYVPAPVLMINAPTTPLQNAPNSNASSSSSAGSASPTTPQMYILPPQQSPVGTQQNSNSFLAMIPAGTKILLTLQRAVDTRTARTGDPIYLRSRFPVLVQGRVVLPAGTYIEGALQQIVVPSHSPSRTTLIQLQRTNLILDNGSIVPTQGMTIIPVRARHAAHFVMQQGSPLEAIMPFNVIIPVAVHPPASNPPVSAPIPVYIPVFGPQSISPIGSSSGNGAGNSATAPKPAPYIK